MFSLFRKEVEKLVGEEAAKYLEAPKAQADLALPCFFLAKREQQPPQEIAQMLAAELNRKNNGKSLIAEIKSMGPYVNFHINFELFTPLAIKSAIKPGYGKGDGKEKIVLEFPGPNTNKPLHLGHVRNMALGMSLSRILSFLGHKTINADIINDRGIHICKSMLAYRKLGNGAEPDKKSDHFVGDYYVLFAKELENKLGTDEELRKMLVDWEKGGKEVRALWKKMNNWAISGMKTTYKRFGMKTGKTYYESEHYMDGKKIVMSKMGSVFKEDEEGNVIADLGEMGKRVVLRSDGTSVYLTQDIALAAKRYRDYKMNRMIYVVGTEQVDHFKALFEIFRLLGYKFWDKSYHLAYGMVNLPEGKMKSREGKVVDADDLMDEMHSLAKEEIKTRNADLPEKDMDSRAEKIGLGAIKFFMLKFDPLKPMVYDPKVSISFNGDTGPYVMYTYARARSIIRKSGRKPKAGSMRSEEKVIVKKLSLFPDVAGSAGMHYNPQLIATYALELCALFNEYYHSTKIIGSDIEDERLSLVLGVSNVLKTCLYLLSIETIEEM